ncbi:NADH ubiquinone oxidoreductase subunit NDUFA12 [Musa troglodytarum]|uniref:NADH dehydrogenase [ubiquinone] 1 alpha subcomplex subunit 12 n=1 Tax=Musa troglodytarum TaxID=320322 RepID=A0A9E7GYM8_9LILI|nr:NADH ubiquinone oxidoreductase subunit NDUFA12 [Musa troglodytarum]
MSKLFSKFLGLFSSRTLVGVDKVGNRYFTRVEEIDGIMKEKRWVIFKGEEDPTSIPVEWICWLNGQRTKAPTPEARAHRTNLLDRNNIWTLFEMIELEARRELIKQNIAILKKKEEEERKSGVRQSKSIGKGGSPDLRSFIRQFPDASFAPKKDEVSDRKDVAKKEERSTEPTGSGKTFRPGAWQPPSS